MRKQKTAMQKTRDEADHLLTPLIQRMYPFCLLCLKPTQVAHHHIKKSESSRLRYEIDNLIPLCHVCHFNLHNHETIYSGKIIDKLGINWHNELISLKDEYVKVNIDFYKNAIIKLNES
jgi:5-methylcytosine-specific restriction endonuclease McrA